MSSSWKPARLQSSYTDVHALLYSENQFFCFYSEYPSQGTGLQQGTLLGGQQEDGGSQLQDHKVTLDLKEPK